jgi:N-methylhydantoinase A
MSGIKSLPAVPGQSQEHGVGMDSSESGNCRIGIDVGGTFTDLVLVDPRLDGPIYYKEASTPHDPSLAVERGLLGIIERAGISARAIGLIVHGTTLGLNTIIQRRGARMALVVSRGHRDLLEFGRLQMPNSFDMFDLKEVPLVPRDLAFEVSDRGGTTGMAGAGNEAAEIGHLARELRRMDITSVAVVLLNSYKNGAMESRIAQQLRQEMPGALVTESAQLWPEMREFERGMVAALNAYIHPQLNAYFTRLQQRLAAISVQAPIHITTNNGGTIGLATARARPIDTVLSGPAAGVVASCGIAKSCRIDRFVTFDMGGTSSDMAVTIGGRPEYSTHSRVGEFPLIMPVVNVSAIGAGGGSIVWVDPHGILKVGPRSAGADPGPVCYGLGGQEVTITDCYLALGILRPDGFLGGRMRLDSAAAERALAVLARRLGYQGVEAVPRTAEAALRVATAKMATEVRRGFAQRGQDPHDFALVAYGGAGPTHGNLLADDVGLRAFIVPASPGTLCALGAVLGELKRDFVRTVRQRLEPPVATDLKRLAASLLDEAHNWLATERGPAGHMLRTLWTAELRYPQEGIGLTVELEESIVAGADLAGMATAFHAEHERIYGFRDLSGGVELLNLHAQVVGAAPAPAVATRACSRRASVDPTQRKVFTQGHWRLTNVYQRESLAPGSVILGPALVEQEDTTAWIIDGWHGAIGDDGIIRNERAVT